MTIEQALIFLTGIIVAMLAAYAGVLFLWHREDKTAANDHWEVGCRVRTSRDPHGFLPGVWMPSVTFNDGSREWERIA